MTDRAATTSIENAIREGLGRLRERMYNLAELVLLDAQKQAPQDPRVLHLLGIACHKLRHTEVALTHLRSAAAADDRQVVWWDLAVVLRDTGDMAGAQSAYDKALSLIGVDPQAVALSPLAILPPSTDRISYPFRIVDYPYRAVIRYGAGRPPHPELADIIGAGREMYLDFLAPLTDVQADLALIPRLGSYNAKHPFWLNTWFLSLDALALIQMLRSRSPSLFLEVGSGMSTKFARFAVDTFGLPTRLISLDPEPRNKVDALCDEVIRQPLEKTDLARFRSLEPGDILFIDSSHRVFQNSDVTVLFLEILPRLKPGVIVHIHDIYLPDDYISGHVLRLWNEQYLLATALLFGDRFDVLFPSWFVSQDPELAARVRAQLGPGPFESIDLVGQSFWMTRR